MEQLKFAVLGAGAGGQTMAAVLSSGGYSVKLYDNDREKIARLNELGKITVTGKFACEGFPQLVTADIAAAVADVDVIMVTTTTDAHREIANLCAPYLRDGQIFLLNPGHVGGALEVRHIIREVHGCRADVVIGETGDLMYACRTAEVGQTFQSGVKNKVEVATIPAGDVKRVMEALGPVFPNLTAAKNILETGFEGGGAMLHPIPSLMNITNTDMGQGYDYYMEGITPSVARLVSACDAERLRVCRALGLEVPSLVKTLQKIYGLEQEDLYDLLQHNNAYRGLKSPMNLKHRFLVEDTVCGLVPLSSIGRMLGVETPVMDAFIEISSIVCGRDFRKEGRTAEKLGLAGKTLEEIYELIS
ncbi:NAD/NADP-dependent octopine/nopaline dehydrogenase family protein [Oscillibacter sp.]|uniref:NAD/NADP-dependent octopine/nopaline dehydrogenase family protein n=1 Tax=Oscillibacter sp. TaxID=1945593 RepID=UPI00260FCEE0|nr:NAD/NADP-dependent octopine/nopaline dehydrogenase family protein [Oscillibacter sp.]MDD3347677.1 NAD/NADP octopine/nopaline dehydrogenase family protein [Oscillibacter sp.]